MNRFLIWFMHPDRQSFNGAILDTYADELKKQGKEIDIRTIAELDLSPHLFPDEYNASLEGRYPDVIKKEHEKMEWADVITFIFPLWWGSFPAAGKGFLDRVLSYGFAYELEGETPVPRMKGKKAAMIYTTGTPEEKFIEKGSKCRIEETWKEEIFSFCGFDCLPFLHFGDVIQASDTKRQQMLEKVRKYARKHTDMR
ncbi:NAD(P)H-dependent oxidoreductase [Alteribacillus bidgolensis]|uniref:NAD(P)H dehydrogenase (Quinone) n=1 Tax=Alteribacillus bidgolensis TaxID=930129 RepID=A0A1G8MH59_9BACI|nr:NAD(P)H-dependent oxidoreductase [Alteribacillus bidgolensis]SDI67289.1 NAD(P)H dehydrogenase (quinone) [Alteribacillus bidgolensis]